MHRLFGIGPTGVAAPTVPAAPRAERPFQDRLGLGLVHFGDMLHGGLNPFNPNAKQTGLAGNMLTSEAAQARTAESARQFDVGIQQDQAFMKRMALVAAKAGRPDLAQLALTGKDGADEVAKVLGDIATPTGMMKEAQAVGGKDWRPLLDKWRSKRDVESLSEKLTYKRFENAFTELDAQRPMINRIKPGMQQYLAAIKSGRPIGGPVKQYLNQVDKIATDVFGAPIFGEDRLAGVASLQALSYWMTPRMRVEGTGSTSDMEFNAFMEAVSKMGNLDQQNYVILWAIKEAHRREEHYQNEKLTKMTEGMSESEFRKWWSKSNPFGEFYKRVPENLSPEEQADWAEKLPEGTVFMWPDAELGVAY
jgi:hypothetical protein